MSINFEDFCKKFKSDDVIIHLDNSYSADNDIFFSGTSREIVKMFAQRHSIDDQTCGNYINEDGTVNRELTSFMAEYMIDGIFTNDDGSITLSCWEDYDSKTSDFMDELVYPLLSNDYKNKNTIKFYVKNKDNIILSLTGEKDYSTASDIALYLIGDITAISYESATRTFYAKLKLKHNKPVVISSSICTHKYPDGRLSIDGYVCKKCGQHVYNIIDIIQSDPLDSITSIRDFYNAAIAHQGFLTQSEINDISDVLKALKLIDTKTSKIKNRFKAREDELRGQA